MDSLEAVKARQEYLKVQIEQVKLKSLERELKRENRGLKLQDISDQQLEIKIISEETKLSTAKAKLESLKTGLKEAVSESKYRTASLTIKERLWANDLTLQEYQLTDSRRRIEGIKEAVRLLGNLKQNTLKG